jgi:hypothetical protein
LIVENAENRVQIDLNGLYINCIMKLLIGNATFSEGKSNEGGGGIKDANI